MKLSFGVSIELSVNGLRESHYNKKFIDGGRFCNESATCENAAAAFDVKEDIECDGEELRIYGDVFKDILHEVNDLAEKINKPVQEAVQRINNESKEASSTTTTQEKPEEVKLEEDMMEYLRTPDSHNIQKAFDLLKRAEMLGPEWEQGNMGLCTDVRGTLADLQWQGSRKLGR